MGKILATKEPLSVSAHSQLQGEDKPAGLMKLILPGLGSLLSGVDQQDILVWPLHTTFSDFLADPKRSKFYYVDLSEHARSLTLSSL
jgi:hypothetical protein